MRTRASAICLGLLVAGLLRHPALAADNAVHSFVLSRPLSALDGAATPAPAEPAPAVGHRPRRANFEREIASRDTRYMADWIADSGDNRNMPFAIIDKKNARVFVFAADARLRGASPALLGLAVGDDATPGIGDRPLSSIRPEERTTPAGRFVAALDRNLGGKEILWVDYDGAVSMHPVVSAKPEERRLQRLASPTPLDNRISYGCINVPAKFFETVVHPAFSGTNGIVYVLPETRPVSGFFGSYEVEHTGLR
ncbi:MAG: hypothetical protein Q7J42_10050 [Sulfuritalea sp.]|nr:hypothetical protein [Sulfuritalea sp.]